MCVCMCVRMFVCMYVCMCVYKYNNYIGIIILFLMQVAYMISDIWNYGSHNLSEAEGHCTNEY